MLRLIPLSEIKISPTRQRKEFRHEEILSLAESIRANSLLHAPILRHDGDGYTLVAGERRLRAIKNIYELDGTFSYDGRPVPAGLVPHTLLSDLSSLAAEEAELEENIRRIDLSWQERAAATARLAALRTAQAKLAGAPPPTAQDIALEVRGASTGSPGETTRREILVARHLADSDVAAASSVDEAFKILRKKEERKKVEELGERIGRTFNSSSHQALNEDATEWLGKCPDGVFDVILTDPPYGMGADKFGDSGSEGTGDHTYSDDFETFRRCLAASAAHFSRITKPQAHLYWFCDLDNFFLCRTAFQEGGWEVFRTPLIWYNPTGFRMPWVEYGPQRKYECILYGVKGKRRTRTKSPDVITFPRENTEAHAAQKPAALFLDLLQRSCVPGDTVLDPFMGSGTIFPAAHELRVRATGIEIDLGNYGIALKRLGALKEMV